MKESFLAKVKADIDAYLNKRNFRGLVLVVLFSSGFKSVLTFRIQEALYKRGFLSLSYLIHDYNLTRYGIDLMPGCKIGGGLRIEHPVGVVVGAGAIIGQNVTIMQGVTLGVKHLRRERNTNQYPVVGDNVIIGLNSSILGDVEIPSNVNVKGHSLIYDKKSPWRS